MTQQRIRRRKSLKQFLRDRRGTLAVEMAMATPVIFGLLVAGVEVTRYVLLHQKVERTSATMADLVSQAHTLSETGLNNLFAAGTQVMAPYKLADGGRVIVSSIVNATGSQATISWQRSYGASAGGSAFGTEGGNANLPTDFIVRSGENVIAVEVHFEYQPMLTTAAVTTQNVYKIALFRPRFGSLATLSP